MRTLGIDLSANPAKTGACEINWDLGTVQVIQRPATDHRLVEAIGAADMTGIDIPFGWPDAFVTAVIAHYHGQPWPPAATAPPADREPLRFRLTDLVIRASGAQPLSVSTDRIGVATMRGARLQHLLAQAGVPIDRSGTAGRIAEVYPAAALRHWGLTSSGYKGSPNASICRTLAARVAARCAPITSAVTSCLEECDDDALDALLCAIVARAVVLGLTSQPAADQMEAARREGWIHVPTVSIEEIAAADNPRKPPTPEPA